MIAQIDPLTAFSFLWALAVLFHAASYGAWAEHPLQALLNLTAALVLCRPRSQGPFLALLTAQIATVLWELPVVSNHWFVAALASCTWLATYPGLQRGANVSAGLQFRKRWYEQAAPLLRALLIITYVWATGHKLNWDFLNPEVSCAGEHLEQLSRLLGVAIVPVSVAVWGTVLLEGALVVLLTVRRWRPWGVALGVPFHALLGVNGFYNFSAMLYALYLCFLSVEQLGHITGAVHRGMKHLLGRASALPGGGRQGMLAMLIVSAAVVDLERWSAATSALLGMVRETGWLHAVSLALFKGGLLAWLAWGRRYRWLAAGAAMVWLWVGLSVGIEDRALALAAAAVLLRGYLPGDAMALLSVWVLRSGGALPDDRVLGLAVFALVAATLIPLLFLCVWRSPSPHVAIRGTGARWAAIIPLFLLLNGLSPYLGLKTETSLAMFSNLRTEEGRFNHVFIPPGFQIFDYQQELITVEGSAHPAFRRLAAQRRVLPEISLRLRLSQIREARGGPVDLRLNVGGERIDLEAAEVHERYGATPALWERKMLRFSRISGEEGPQTCRH